MTFRLNHTTMEEIAALAEAWGCSRGEVVRRAVQQAVRSEEAMRPVLERLANIEARLAGGVLATPAAPPTDAATATMRSLTAWATDDE